MAAAFQSSHVAYVQLLRGYAEITSLDFVCRAMEEALQARWRPETGDPAGPGMLAATPSLTSAATNPTIPVRQRDKRRAVRMSPALPAPVPPPGRREGSHHRGGRDRRRGHRGGRGGWGRDRAAGAAGEEAAARPASLRPPPMHAPLHEPRPRRPLFAARHDAVRLLAPTF